MPCGCTSACGCIVKGDGVTAEVAKSGSDTFTVSAILFVRSVADTDCIDLEVDNQGQLTAAPILADEAESASVQLLCTPDGLTGDVRVDPASTAPISLTPDGLRVDLPIPEPVADTATAGTLKATARISDEPGWLDADGSEVTRAYSALLDALSLVTLTGTRVIGSAQLTGVRTRGLAPGMPVEADGFGAATVLSIDGTTTLTLDTAASSSGSDTVVRVFPYGNGDGASTFNLPLVDENGYVRNMVAGEALGAQSGANSVNLTVAQLPSHDHAGTSAVSNAVSNAVTSVTILAGGGHTHGAGAASDRSYVTVDSTGAGLQQALISVAGSDDVGIQLGPAVNLGVPQQTNNQATSPGGTHDHVGTAVTTVSTTVGTSVTVAPQGGGAAVENRPLSRSFRWLVKV